MPTATGGYLYQPLPFSPDEALPVRSFLFRLYAHCFVDELMLIYAFYAVMFVDRGMSPMQISILLAAWCAITIVLEIPSGVLADRHSRKGLMVIGSGFRALGYLCWLFFPGFWGFLAGFILWGIEGALGSGAFEAFLYDELKHLGREAEYALVQGRCRSIGQLGIVASAAIASWAVSFGYDVLIWSSSIAALVAGALLLSLPSAAPVAPIGSSGYGAYMTTLRAGIGEVVLRPYVRRLVLFATMAMALAGTLDEYWSIFLDEMGMEPWVLGLFLSVLCSVQALASWTAHRFVDVSDSTIYGGCLLGGLCLTISAWWAHAAGIFLLLIFVFILQVIDIVYDARLQAAIPSAHRATASSVKSFGFEVGGILLTMVMGLVVTGRTYQLGFETFGVLTTLLGIIYLTMGQQTARTPVGDAPR